MKVLVIGSGIAGLTAAIRSAELDCSVVLVSPYVSERAQSVMAAGGINAVLDDTGEYDSVDIHVKDTIKAGVFLESEDSVRGLCEAAPDIVRWLDSIGVIFSRTGDGKIAQRAFGGQSKDRTCYAGASTGKQIVTALTRKCREYEISGQIERRTGLHFHSALIRGGRAYGAVFTDDVTEEAVPVFADAVIMASGGMNALFGKTTGSELCDGYAASMLMAEGAKLRNLEFIQYHPTTIETANKRMLVSEAARGEGGRLYYEEHGKRVYFMEDRYGEHGNLMPRDIVSRCIYNCPSQVYLDVSFLGKEVIHDRLEEVEDLCDQYLGIDICRESIPVSPSVHFFMGGIKVDDCHETDIQALFAAGECASKYHGANRLGGNSLLAAVYSGETAAKTAVDKYGAEAGSADSGTPDFTGRIEEIKSEIAELKESSEISEKAVPVTAVKKCLAKIMNQDLGIVRDAEGLKRGIAETESMIRDVKKYGVSRDFSLYERYRVYHMLLLAEAILMSAFAREESRGAHHRVDFPETKEEYRKDTIAEFRDGMLHIRFEPVEKDSAESDGGTDDIAENYSGRDDNAGNSSGTGDDSEKGGGAE